MKNVSLLLLIFSFLNGYSQNGKVNLKYFLNEKHLRIKDAKVFIITEKDSTQLIVKRNKVILPIMKSTFEILIKVDNEDFVFPKCLAEMSTATSQIFFGKINDKTTLKKITEGLKKGNYILDDNCTIYVKELSSFEELNFITISFSSKINNNTVLTKETGTVHIIK